MELINQADALLNNICFIFPPPAYKVFLHKTWKAKFEFRIPGLLVLSAREHGGTEGLAGLSLTPAPACTTNG